MVLILYHAMRGMDVMSGTLMKKLIGLYPNEEITGRQQFAGHAPMLRTHYD